MEKTIKTLAKEYSMQLCDTMMRKFEAKDLPPKEHFHYHQGVFLSGVYKTYIQTEETKYKTYVHDWLDYYIDDQGEITGCHPVQMDDIQPGILLYPFLGDKVKFEKALKRLISYMDQYPKNDLGAFYHKDHLMGEMWLDGIYMGGPLLAEYGYRFKEETYIKEAVKQVKLMFEVTKDPRTGLLYHAYDHLRLTDWSDKETGLSPEFWGRAIGWIIIGTMDIMTFMDAQSEDYKILSKLVKELLLSVIKFQSDEGRWYQVVDKGDDEKNWYENSCSALFTGGIYKAITMGILEESYRTTADKGFRAILNSMSYSGEDLILDSICVGTGVGDYKHYINRPTSENDLHGTGVFLIMCSEAYNA